MQAAAEPTSEARPTIVPRDIDFDLPEDLPRHWHSGNPWITHYFNGLSMMFPDGEKFFMDAVRHYRDRIDDPVLQRDIRGFLGQEGVHAREHHAYNVLLERQGLPGAKMERMVKRLVAFDRKVMPPALQLAVTAALEHFTAIMADVILRDPRSLEGAHPSMQRLWRWHAMEEAEHKSVAFDVLRKIVPGWRGYLLRFYAMITTTLLFTLNIVVFQVWLVAADRRLTDGRAYLSSLRYFWITPGVVPQAMRLYLSWYRPSFHPWDHDNSDLVEAARAAYA